MATVDVLTMSDASSVSLIQLFLNDDDTVHFAVYMSNFYLIFTRHEGCQKH
jgi:hypothetical protein